MPSPQPHRLTIAAGELAADIAPALGASLMSFTWTDTHTHNLMRRAPAEARTAGEAAMFLMLPFANRIGGNAFDYEGRRHTFEPNVPGQALVLHGDAWTSPWEVVRHSERSCALRLERWRPDGGFSYRATVTYAIDASGLRVELSIENIGTYPMPFGLGLHPWWVREPGMTMQFRATRFWLEGPNHMPTEAISIPPELDFAEGRAAPTTWRNNGYAGWDGAAELWLPSVGRRLHIAADARFRHLVLYSDPNSPFLCLEPQTHAIGALNRCAQSAADTSDLARLAPGEAFETWACFTVAL